MWVLEGMNYHYAKLLGSWTHCPASKKSSKANYWVITSHHYKKKTTEQLGDANKIDLYTFIRQTFLLLETLYLIVTFFSNEGEDIKIILVHNSIT